MNSIVSLSNCLTKLINRIGSGSYARYDCYDEAYIVLESFKLMNLSNIDIQIKYDIIWSRGVWKQVNIIIKRTDNKTMINLISELVENHINMPGTEINISQIILYKT